MAGRGGGLRFVILEDLSNPGHSVILGGVSDLV